jgi:chemotaxis response regulator CheB
MTQPLENKPHDEQPRALGPPCPIVCIGISSGGIFPLKQILKAVGHKTGMAFVVIHHVSHVETLLPEILAGSTVMPIQWASPGLPVQPNHVYVLPSGKELMAKNGCFSVRPRSKPNGRSNVFSVLLGSLSKGRHPGIAITLSGLYADGAAALKGFKKMGGITIAQNPATAQEPQMPLAAIQTGYVDYILAPQAIALKLQKIAEDLKAAELAIP